MSISERLRWEEVRPEGEPEPLEEEEQSIGLWGKVAIGVGAVLGAAIQIAAFRIAPDRDRQAGGPDRARAFIVADAAIRLALLLGMLMFLSLLRPFRKILKYHGAEHKAIATHEAGHQLTAAAAAGFSRFHPRCGTSFLVVSAFVSIAVYGAVLAITGVFTYLALIATRDRLRRSSRPSPSRSSARPRGTRTGACEFLSWPGMWAQRLTTRDPEEEQLEVACAALAVALEEPDAVPAGVHGEVVHPGRDAVAGGRSPTAGRSRPSRRPGLRHCLRGAPSTLGGGDVWCPCRGGVGDVLVRGRGRQRPAPGARRRRGRSVADRRGRSPPTARGSRRARATRSAPARCGCTPTAAR